MAKHDHTQTIGRRAFLRNGTLVLAGANLGWTSGLDLFAAEVDAAATAKPSVLVGLVTDIHHAEKPAKGTRYYRESLSKLTEAAERLNRDSPDFVVSLGDLIDAADTVAEEQGFVKSATAALSAASDKRHFVLGNHCVYTLTKQEFLEGVGQKQSYYSFDQGGVHFVILDACFRADGTPYGRKNFETSDTNIAAAELDWLRADLKAAKGQTIVFVHQRLDISTTAGVKNAKDVRQALEASGKVLAVFQGHTHENDYNDIKGIHYCTLKAMVEGSGAENNGYSTMAISPSGTIRINGFRKQKNYAWG